MRRDLLTALADLPERLLVGVSGGIDSVVLLHALVAVGKKPVVLHFDHAWRSESTADARFVQKFAATYKLKFISARARAGAKKTEQSARAARWAFFEKTAKKLRLAPLVLAHNADDQVETFLLQLLRGGGSGARGMRPVTKRGALMIHRPWLGTWRRDITAYAKQNKLCWREDVSNLDTRYRRNAVRHRLLPYLQKNFSADAPQALWRAAEILGAESEWLDTLSASASSLAKKLSVKTLRTQPVALQRRLLRTWLVAHDIADVSFDDVEAVRGLLTHRFPAKVNLSGDRFARRREGVLFLEGSASQSSARAF